MIFSRQETQIQSDDVNPSYCVPPKYRSKICVMREVRVQNSAESMVDDAEADSTAFKLGAEVECAVRGSFPR